MSKRLTNEQLTQIAERAEKATEGPWMASDGIYVIELDGTHPEGYGEVVAECERTVDAEFIAHAREDIPKLLAEIERLKDQGRCQNDKLKRTEGMKHYCQGYADRSSEIISEQGKKIEDLKAELAKYRKFVQCVEHSEISVDEGTIFIKLRGDYEDLISEFIGVGGETACLKD